MPPRKSGASITAASATDPAAGDVTLVSNATNATTSPTQHAHPKQARQSGGAQQGKQQDDGVGIDDLLLPRSLISRLSRGVLPANTSLQKDALLAITRSATVFISYLAHHANEQSQQRHRKTLGVQDVYAALEQIEFAGVMEMGKSGVDGRVGGRLEKEVEMFEEAVMRKRRGYREKVKARESAGGVEEEGEGDGERSSKKARRMSQEQEEDEDERMLEQQLNGTGGSAAGNEGGEGVKDKGISVVVQNGHNRPTNPNTNNEEEDDNLEDADDDPIGDEGEEDEEEQDDAEEGDEDEDEDEDETEDDELVELGELGPRPEFLSDEDENVILDTLYHRGVAAKQRKKARLPNVAPNGEVVVDTEDEEESDE